MKFGKIPAQLWNGSTFKKCEPVTKLVAAYLLSCTHGNLLGIFRVPVEYVAFDLQLTADVILKAISSLESIGFLKYNAETAWIIIWHFLEWNRPANPNIVKHLNDILDELPIDTGLDDDLTTFIDNNAEVLNI